MAILGWVGGLALVPAAQGIDIVLDYTLDEMNGNWFDPETAIGRGRRRAVQSASGFLSTIIVNDDWKRLSSLNESFSLSDLAMSSINDLSGNVIFGEQEDDGEGFRFDIRTTDRSTVEANQYVVYVGAFEFDADTTSNAKGGWDSSDRRNAAGENLVEFNTWGGKVYFNTNKVWYTGSDPDLDPTDDYGVQDFEKLPSRDVASDNWDWDVSDESWKGFDLKTIDSLATDRRDLYATALHELMHALGASGSNFEKYVGVNDDDELIGDHVMAEFGGPVPRSGGHFAEDTQSVVWDSLGIVSETVLDPNSRRGVRKYFTQLDAALLRDLGYDVLASWKGVGLIADINNDGHVDFADFLILSTNFGLSGRDIVDQRADLDEDGEVAFPDFLLLSDSFGLSAVRAVPEPPALLIVALPVLLVMRRGTRGRG